MANTKSAIKRMKQNEKRRQRNRAHPQQSPLHREGRPRRCRDPGRPRPRTPSGRRSARSTAP